jgi:MIP family channel proteins
MTNLRAALTAEFLGTMILIVLGDGVVGSAVLLEKQGGWVVITTGWALAVTLGVYVSGRVSGGHLNPAVTLALAVRRGFPWERVAPYCAAQLAGAFVGAVIVYVDYFEAFGAFETAQNISRGAMEAGKLAGAAAGGAGVFATYPVFDSLPHNFFSEFLGTLMLVLVVFALTDSRNQSTGSNLTPLLVGFTVWSIGLSLGGLTGYAINPARDLGPRIASAVLGWGPAVFTSHDSYFWVPIIAPLAGGVVGGALYDLAIGRFLNMKPPPSGMYERFSDRARKVMQLTNQEAQRLNHEFIGTEHILLGLVKEGAGTAATVLKNLNIDLSMIRLEVEKIVQGGPDMLLPGRLPLTPSAKNAIEYSMEGARNLNHNYVGTEHLLLGLLREQEGVARHVLTNLGLKLEVVREEMLKLLGHGKELS